MSPLEWEEYAAMKNRIAELEADLQSEIDAHAKTRCDEAEARVECERLRAERNDALAEAERLKKQIGGIYSKL